MALTQGIASIGIEVKIGNHSMNYVTNIGDIGGEPEQLDATCFNDRMRHNKPGVQDAGSFSVDFLYDNGDADSDFRVVKALDNVDNTVVEVTFPDGTKFASKGTPSTHVTGVGVNALIAARCSISLSEDWNITNPST